MRQTPAPTYAPDGSFGGYRPEPGRFDGIRRDYSPGDVARLSGSFRIEHTLADMGARRLWQLLKTEPQVTTLGALTGMQALQQVKAGLKAIYLSGWQVAADANTAGTMYPDQSLYPVDSVPNVVRRINNSLRRADQIAVQEGKGDTTNWMAPIVADAEAGFGGALNAYELMRAMIDAGAAGVHFEDQLASEKKCGHLGGKVLIHCRGGLGRAGLVAALLLVEEGVSPPEAIRRVRAARPGAIFPTQSASAFLQFQPDPTEYSE